MDENRRICAMCETAPEPSNNLHLGRIALTRVKERSQNYINRAVASGGSNKSAESITAVKGITK